MLTYAPTLCVGALMQYQDGYVLMLTQRSLA